MTSPLVDGVSTHACISTSHPRDSLKNKQQDISAYGFAIVCIVRNRNGSNNFANPPSHRRTKHRVRSPCLPKGLRDASQSSRQEAAAAISIQARRSCGGRLAWVLGSGAFSFQVIHGGKRMTVIREERFTLNSLVSPFQTPYAACCLRYVRNIRAILNNYQYYPSGLLIIMAAA